MSASSEHALYRLRRTRREGPPVKHYRGTWELSDDRTKQVLATCHLMRAVVFGTHEIVDDAQQVWHLAANRAIMPSRWLLSDPAQRLVLQFQQHILRKFLNPWRRTGLVLLDADDRELFRLADPRTSALHRTFGPRIDDWVVMERDQPAAKLVRLPKKEEPKGLLGHLSKLLGRSDQGIASVGPAHALSAPAALALLMLVNELTDSSAVE
ncbi:MAG TPA: hypothetical protein VJ790_05435 [Dongiaceae bacterium]|nr:hypothetical protein [Dongiaceae bacterium]